MAEMRDSLPVLSRKRPVLAYSGRFFCGEKFIHFASALVFILPIGKIETTLRF